MSKQTAVEWLQEKLNKILIDNQIQQTEHLFDQAKQMEKEQIMNAHLTGLIYPLEMEACKQAEQYYNETFNTKDCQFYPKMDTTSATICANCGREKFEHNL